MKKIICIILLIIISISCLGCEKQIASQNLQTNPITGNGTSGDYVALLYDFSDSIGSGKKQKEYDFADTEKYKNVKIQKQKNVKLQGKEFIGSYKETKFKSHNFYPEFEYTTSNDAKFSVDENGKLVSYINSDIKVTQNVLSQEECVQKAKEFLKDVVDITPYTIQVVDETKNDCYKVNFIKYINGIKTTDQVRVRVNYDGSIYSYSAFMLERVPVNTKTDDIDFEQIKQAVISKVDAIYSDKKDNYDRIDYGEPEYTLTILKDGKRAIICQINIDAVAVMGFYEGHMGELLEMVIPVE